MSAMESETTVDSQRAQNGTGVGQVPRRADVINVLQEHRDELARMGVASLTLFGSVARDEAGSESDVDLLVELNRRMGLFGFLEIQERLEALLGRKVDLGMADGLKPRLRDRIQREAVRAF